MLDLMQPHLTLQIANATSLTLGLYEFELTVADENNNTATDTTWVKIVQGNHIHNLQ